MRNKIKITKNILSVFSITLALLMAVPYVTVYAGPIGNQQIGGQNTGEKGGSDSGGGNSQNTGGKESNNTDGNTDGNGDSGGGSGNSGSGGSGSGSGASELSKQSFYDSTDSWGTWTPISTMGYYESEDTYVVIKTEMLDISTSDVKQYSWTLDYKKLVGDTYKQKISKVNMEDTWEGRKRLSFFYCQK